MARRRLLLVPAVLAVGVVVAACSPPGSDSAKGPSARPVSSISTNPARAGDVTLTVWDQEVRGGQNTEISRLNAEFHRKYPNVTIKRTAKSFTDLKTTLKLALSGNNPPDVVEANQGYADMVAFAKAGMLTPLDNYAAAYGWTKRYPKALLSSDRVSDGGKRFGSGRLYGIPQMGEYIGLYYNKKKLRALHIDPPQTWQELTAALAKAKASGQLPVQFGNLDKYPAIHTFGVLQGQAAGTTAVRDLVYGKGSVSWTDPATVKAATTLRDWVRKGWLPSGANGLGYDDAAKQFAGGTGVFLLTGTWEAATLAEPMGDDLGWMPPPPAAGAQTVTTGGTSLGFAVTSKSKHPDVAAAYLNFLTDAHAADVMTKAGTLPAVPGAAADALAPDSMQGQIVAGWKKVTAADGLVPYLDYSTPTFYDTITAALQQLISGRLTPRQFAARLQHDYDTFHGK